MLVMVVANGQERFNRKYWLGFKEAILQKNVRSSKICSALRDLVSRRDNHVTARYVGECVCCVAGYFGWEIWILKWTRYN